MTRERHLVLAAILGSLVCPSATEAQTILPSSATRTSSKTAIVELANSVSIEGVVVDERGTPLPRVRVRALGPGSTVNSTDSNGFFRLTSLPPGRYVVRAYAAGYTAAMSSRINIERGVTPSLRLTLLRESEPAAEQPTEATGRAGCWSGIERQRATSWTILLSRRRQTRSMSAILPATRQDDAGETAWRMRHLKRTPLKDVDGAWREVTTDTFTPGSATALQRAVATSAHLASSLFDLSLTGQVNLLTSGTFDSPLELFLLRSVYAQRRLRLAGRGRRGCRNVGRARRDDTG